MLLSSVILVRRYSLPSQALKEYLPSSLAWQRALDTLPTENLTPTQEQQREEYQKRLYESTDRLHHKASGGDRSMDTRYYRDGDGQQPWEVAREMIPALEASGNTSSSVRNCFCFVNVLIDTRHLGLGTAWSV